MHQGTPHHPAPRSDFPIIVVTGLSGAGKSTAINVFEDIRFFTVDGLPASVVPGIAQALGQDSLAGFKGLVLGVNLQQPGAVDQFIEALDRLNDFGLFPAIVFVEATAAALMQRYATTRRPHPLESEGFGLEQAINAENDRLAPIRERAELVIDTSGYSIHDLRRTILKKWEQARENAHSLKVRLMSFGFKYGTPAEADMVLDLRFLPNPYFDPALKDFSGLDGPVANYVLRREPGQTFVRKLVDFLLYLLPLFESEGRYRMTVALGCTGGRHRSVAVTEAVAKALRQHDFSVTTEHRHLELG